MGRDGVNAKKKRAKIFQEHVLDKQWWEDLEYMIIFTHPVSYNEGH